MTKYVLAPDSFKESMSARMVCQAMENGIRRIEPDAEIKSVPMADGGEGTTDSLISATNGKKFFVNVTGPLGQKITAYYGILDDDETAVIEMAKASGLELIPQNGRNPLITTTYGVGEMVIDALDRGVKQIIIGLGGSSTNDGGAGMLQALNVNLLDENNQKLNFGGGELNKLAKIETDQIDPRVAKTRFILASDVINPLTGKNGASYVFGAQKGATTEMVDILDRNLHHYAEIIKKDLNQEVEFKPGSGAAGGLGAGFMALGKCEFHNGIDIVIKLTNLEQYIKTADYVFTGEGATDFQTKFGKTPFGVAQLAKKYDKPLISIAGSLGKGIDQLYSEGFTALFSITPEVCDLATALENGPKNVENTIENIIRLLQQRR